MRNSFLITIGVFIAVALLLNKLVKPPVFKTLDDKADFEIQANHPEMAEGTLLQLIAQDSFNIDHHYQLITNHFDIPKKKKVGKYDYVYRDEATLRNLYDGLIASPDSNLADVGNYGKGLIAEYNEDYLSALNCFELIKNKKLKYLNNSLGFVLRALDSLPQAERCFKKEISNKGFVSGGYRNLIQIYYDRNDLTELNKLLANKETREYFPAKTERSIYFKQLQPLNYFYILLKKIFSNINIWGLLAAFLIMGSWIMYLRKIDIFEVEKWRNIVFAVGMGMLMSFFTFPLSDLNNLIFGFKLNGNLLNDFFYSVIGIGAIEEFVKIVPLLIILRFTKIITEPFDYILYASLSALGFAFIENLIYFSEHNLHIIHGRAITAVVSHMFDSSIIAYGLILNKYKRQWNPYLNFLLFFGLAALSHGFYDFWLINKMASNFSILTFIFLMISMFMWSSFKNNALNQSSFYDKDISINSQKLQDYLFYSLSGVLLFEYIALAFKFSPSIANSGLISSMYSGTYLVIFLSGNLSRFNLNKGEWAPIRYWGTSGSGENYDRILDLDIKIDRFTKNDLAYSYLPNGGKIIKRLNVSKEPDWYLVKLSDPKLVDPFLHDTVLIRTKEKNEQIRKGVRTYCAFYAIPVQTDLTKDGLMRTDFKFCGWVTAE